MLNRGWTVDCVPDVILDNQSVHKQTFGVISSLTVAGKKLDTAFEPKNPATGKAEKMVGILQCFAWDGGDNNHISIVALCPEDVAQEVDKLLTADIKDVNVEMAFSVWEWDDVHGYWEARHSDGKAIKGTIPTNGGQLQIAMDRTKSDQYSVGNRKLHDFRMVMLPNDENHIHAGNFKGQVVVRQWGIKGQDKK